MSTDPTQNSAASEALSASAPAVAHILIAEDNEEIRMLLQDTFSTGSYSVVEARNGQEAVQKYAAAQGKIDLMLLDLHLPDTSGWDVLARIRQLGSTVPVLILSGSSTEDFTQRVEEAGAAGFVRKPFDCSVLLKTVESLLKAH